jgi:ribosomal peptide maturation radical SAM protein 1
LAASGGAVHLVCMPWHGLRFAPLALAQVRGTIARTHPHVQVREHFCNLQWAEYLLAASGGAITPHDYHLVAERGIHLGLGDWVFAGSLYGDASWADVEMQRFAAGIGADIGAAGQMRKLAGEFIETTAARIAAARPAAVGFTTTFMQNMSSLALAQAIKNRSPDTVIIFGGANCDGPMGAALHRNHRFIDYAVRGECEIVLPQLLDRIMAGADGEGLDGVCWWRDGMAVANPQLQPAVPAELIPETSYDSWHAAFRSSPVRGWVAPYLVLQGSRGCWWGARHHCTFCGIPDATISFRSRPSARLQSELAELVARYQILDVVTADNIMDAGYYNELLPWLEASGWDLRVHWELKANVTEQQIARLAAAGLVMVQFGIESFSNGVLRLMNKGLTGAAAVRVLRDAASWGVSVEWNYLYGFPGERAADYTHVIRQMPALVHLQPPGGTGDRIVLQRFSPYFERPELGFPERRPAAFYSLVYDLPPAELAELAYYFECADAGIGGETEGALNAALARWAAAFPSSYLVAEPAAETLTVRDRREGWPHRDIQLTGWPRTAYEGLARPRSVRSLQGLLAGAGTHLAADDLLRWLSEMAAQGLVFSDDGDKRRWVALATRRALPKLAGMAGA